MLVVRKNAGPMDTSLTWLEACLCGALYCFTPHNKSSGITYVSMTHRAVFGLTRHRTDNHMNRTKSLPTFLFLSVLLFLPSSQAEDPAWLRYSNSGVEAIQHGHYAEAEKMLTAARTEAEKFGPEDKRLATCLANLASLYDKQGKQEEAKELFKKALTIDAKALGHDNATTAAIRAAYQELLARSTQAMSATPATSSPKDRIHKLMEHKEYIPVELGLLVLLLVSLGCLFGGGYFIYLSVKTVPSLTAWMYSSSRSRYGDDERTWSAGYGILGCFLLFLAFLAGLLPAVALYALFFSAS